ncbi:WD repeats-containing protein [Cryptosporidium ubiquitum]|uniref:WD repeats-containing protein n=1 Tax=Cryptosporidium ubiquitum TaxID=857276 RepID=A0A1J4MEG6_9CRYT|nr:WD repeats-containing protein [Cryptosporidium ubiquitum]OII72375.1 WD repeats-containing protein [Cryptosporidium ubiquitum]
MDSLNDHPKIQEHWLWKKNVPFIYDYLFITPLRWPTLTFSIPPVRFNSENMEIEKKNSDTEHESEISLYGQLLIYGTYSTSVSSSTEGRMADLSSQEKYITISMLDIPNFDNDLLICDGLSDDSSKKKLEKPKYLPPDINSIFKIVVNDDPIKICSRIDESKNRILVASKMLRGEIWFHNIGINEIYDETFKVRARASNNKEEEYEIVTLYSSDHGNSTILNHEYNSGKSGYGMEWGTTNSNWLLSGNEDSSMYIFDVNTCEAIFKDQSYNISCGINDLCWINPTLTPNIFSTVNHQGFLSIYDYRCNLKNSNSNENNPVNKWSISDSPCVSISAHPTVSNLISVGGYDGNIYIIDLRCFSNNKQINSLSSHNKGIINKFKYNFEPVHRLEWHSGGNGLLLSSSLDGKACIWDITRCSNMPIWDQIESNNNRVSRNNIISNSSPNNSKKSLESSNKSADNSMDQEVDIKRSLKLLINNNSSNWTKNEKSDGPNELIGVHSGHTGQITDSHWLFSPNDDSWTVVSTDTLNGLHVWSFNEAVFTSENDLIELSYAKQTNLDQFSIYSTKDYIQNLVDSL